MAKTYPVACECGTVHPCEATQAGTTRPCPCGRNVQVPSLVRLKALADETSISADLEIEYALQSNSLPEENDCWACNSPTAEKQLIQVECEKAEESSNDSSTKGIAMIFTMLFGWIGLLAANTMRKDQQWTVHGRHVVFRLPVRCCGNCQNKLATKANLGTALKRTPLYARLLEKYPDAKIELVKD